MKTLILSLLLSTSIIAHQGYAQEADLPDPNTILAEVNGTAITLGHVVALASRLPEQYNQVETAILYEGILDQLIQQELLAETVDTEAPIAKLSIENEVRSVLATEALAFIAEEAASEERVIEAYDAEVAAFQPGKEFRASHILVGTEEDALELIDALNEGADFAELAVEKSTGPSGPNGGDLGWFGPGMMVEPFDTAVQEMEPGSVSAPVETQFGWHVINLVEIRDTAPPSLEERFVDIAERLRSEAIEARITELEANGVIERPDVEFDVEQIRNIGVLQ
ncbi:MAG: peptidylprolyl isomerase [Pseudomonadota bacterium]